tara:strand:- start:4279 stop:5475 length:1197 start_codon:yes stop_codon:yes gene_type:complete
MTEVDGSKIPATADTFNNDKIGWIGLGKLGMPCAEVIAEKGFPITGYDIEPKHSDMIDIKQSIAECVKDRLHVFIAVPTPHEEGYDGREPTSHKEPRDFDYTILKEVVKECNKHMDKSQNLVIVSTLLPGTMRREIEPLVPNTHLMYNPYLIAMGTVKWDMKNPEMIMIGSRLNRRLQPSKTSMLADFYHKICDRTPRIEFGTWEECESMKIFYNTFISTKLVLVNMIQDVAERIGYMDVDRVTQSLGSCDKRIMSEHYMKAGMGDGGACHPRDNIALRWLAREYGLGYDLFESVMSAREKQAENMAEAILKHGNNIWFSSDSYKSGTGMVDGSYSLLVQNYVIKHGGKIVNGFDNPVEVIVRVHETDNFSADNKTIIFDPWRSYPKAENVVYYGKYK